MYILGISAFYHDSAAALLHNGHLVAAADEERFSRKKHDNSFPKLAVDFCLNTAGIIINDIDYVVFTKSPWLNLSGFCALNYGAIRAPGAPLARQ